MSTIVRAVLVGKVAPLGRHGVPSGIDKRSVDAAVAITTTGLSGDAQGDEKHHGGPEKAVHHYPFDHYRDWRAECPAFAARLAHPGAFGENISTEGLTEANVCIGDVYRLGTALVQVSQGRQPCWRLKERFDDRRMAWRVQESGRTGWYYRVFEMGRVAVGDTMRLVERPADAWTLERVLQVLYRDTLNADCLSCLVELPQLSPSWRELARRRLERRAVEDWSRRLKTPEEATP